MKTNPSFLLTIAALTMLGTYSLHAQLADHPTFRQHPASQEAAPGTVAVFHVELDGEYSSLQWRRNGVALPGETGPTIYYRTSGPYSAWEAAHFDCVAWDLLGGVVISDPAVLTSTEGTFGPFPLSSRNCPLCPPPFVGSWDDVSKGLARTLHFGEAESVTCDFTTMRGLSDPNLTDEFIFTTKGFLGDTDGPSSGASLKRDGVGLPYWMYGWFDFLLRGESRPTCDAYGDSGGGAITYIGPCDASRPIRCTTPPASCRRGYDYYQAQSQMSQSFSWGASQTFTYEGQVFSASRIVFLPSASQRLLLPAVQKRSVSSLTIDNRSTAPSSLTLMKAAGKFSSLHGGSQAPSGYARTAGYDLKAAKRLTAAYAPATGSFVLGSEVAEVADDTELTLSYDKTVVDPLRMMAFSWGASNTGSASIYRGCDVSAGPCSFMDLSLEIAPSSVVPTSPECVLGVLVDVLVSGGPGGGPHVKRTVNVQCVDNQAVPGFPCQLTCDYSELGLTMGTFILKNRGAIVAQAPTTTQLSCPRPFRLRICIPRNGEDMGGIYINLPASTFRLGAADVVADQVIFMPDTVQTQEALCFTKATVGGTGTGQAIVEAVESKTCAITMNKVAVSVPRTSAANEGFFDFVAPGGTSQFVIDPYPTLSKLIVPTSQGYPLDTRGDGRTRITPVQINHQPIGFAPLDILLPNSVSAPGRRLVSPTCDGLPGRCDIACDFFDCDGWVLTARGRNLDNSPPAGPTSMTITAHGRLVSATGAPLGAGPIGSLHGESATGVSEVVLTPDFTPVGSTTHQLILKLQGAVVFTENNRTGGCTLSSWADTAENMDTSVCFRVSSSTGVMEVRTGAGMPPVVCDSLQMMAEFSANQNIFCSAKIDCIASFTGWTSVDLDNVEVIRKSSATIIQQASAVIPISSAIVSPRDAASGLATGKRQHLLSGNTSDPHFPVPAFHVQAPNVGGGVSIDLSGAQAARFSMRRSDYGTGPDCGVRSTFGAQFAKPDSTATPRTARVTIDRNVAGQCVLQPDFTQFAAGELQVYSWPFGTEDCFTGAASTSRGIAPNNGYSVTSPVWPDSIGTACMPGAVFMGDIVIIFFPTPVEMSFGGAPPVTIGAVGFVSRPLAALEPWPIKSCGFICNEPADFVLDDFQVAMMPPAHNLIALDALNPAPNGLEWGVRHAWLQKSYDGKLTTWTESADIDIVVKPDGKICHQARIIPSSTPAIPLPPKDFLRLVGEWNPYDATVSGR